MNKKYISYALTFVGFISLILGVYSQYKMGHFNFTAISKSDYPLDLLIASYLGSLAIPIILFLSAYHLGRYSFFKNIYKFLPTLSQSNSSKFLKISLILIGCIFIIWILIKNLSFGSYEDCILDGKTGRTNAELNLLKKTCRAKYPVLKKTSNGSSGSIYCEMTSIADYKTFDGYIDFRNKIAIIGPVKSEIVSSNQEVIMMKMNIENESIWAPATFSKLDLQTGEYSTKVYGVYDDVIGNCIEK